MAEVETPLGSLVRTVVAHFARELRQRYGAAVREVRLFGSFARGGAHEESDVDVAVVLDHADFDTRRKVIDLATDVGLPHDLLLSPTVFDRETYERWRAQERPLVMDIEREGVPL
jgi:predicted nucleotidyltransferase